MGYSYLQIRLLQIIEWLLLVNANQIKAKEKNIPRLSGLVFKWKISQNSTIKHKRKKIKEVAWSRLNEEAIVFEGVLEPIELNEEYRWSILEWRLIVQTSSDIEFLSIPVSLLLDW